MKLYFGIDHQNKGAAYFKALAEAGYSQAHSADVRGIRFCLADSDWNADRRAELERRGIPLFLYPHAARPMVQYDCPHLNPFPVRCMFTMAPGGVELMRRIGYPYPVEAAGWSLSPVRPFVPRDVKRVLFAPIHPNGNGWLSPVDQELNRKTYRKLSDWCRESGAALTVRFCRELEANGLSSEMALNEPWVTWNKAKPNGSTIQIEENDLVVAHQTFAYMAIAMGVPTLMMGEDIPPRTGNSDASFEYAEHWADYRDYLMYPLDVLNEERTTDEWVHAAAESDAEIAEWKGRFIGAPFDGKTFVERLESYL